MSDTTAKEAERMFTAWQVHRNEQNRSPFGANFADLVKWWRAKKDKQ